MTFLKLEHTIDVMFHELKTDNNPGEATEFFFYNS